MPERNAVVAVFSTHEGAEDAVKELQRSGIDMRTLSIVGKGTHTDEHVMGYYTNGDRMKYWGSAGAYWGGFWGLLFGAAAFTIPGVGPVLMAGPIVASIVAALEGVVVFGSLSALGAAIYGMGIPTNSVIEYEMAVKTDNYLLMVHGSTPDIEKARDIIEGTRPIHVAIHSPEVHALAVR